MDLSIVVPTRNRSRILQKTLEAFGRQTGVVPDWELLVVDDGSSDDTAAIADRFRHHLPVRYFRQPPCGVSKARNHGLREAMGRLVLFLDDDVLPGPRLLAEHLRFHREFPGSEHALLGYVTWDPELPITPFMRWYGEYGGLFAFSRLGDNAPITARYLYSCNISFKAEFLRAAGGFNESLTVLEDYELGYRLDRLRLMLFFRRAAIGFHHQTFTFDQACTRLARYRSGLPPLLATEAGRAMAARRLRPLFRLAEAGIRLTAPVLFPALRGLVDSDRRLPNGIYRLFYWYFASYGSFWSHVSLQAAGKEHKAECN